MTRVKICGITNKKDALKAASLGAWAVGFIFYKKSPRCVGAFKARQIIDALPPFVTPVGVFVNHKEGAVKEILEFCGIRTVQLHGDESPAYCRRLKKYKLIKVARVSPSFKASDLKDYPVSAFLLDTHSDGSYGGTGKTFDWTAVKPVKSLGLPVILSGGLHYNNVSAAIEEVRPYAVDVCSGVETSPGVKNDRSMKNFVDAVEGVQRV